MAFVYKENLGCSVYEPPLTGYDLKHTYFVMRDECAESIIYLHDKEREIHNRFGWSELVTVADIIGLPIKTTCQFLEKWGKVKDGTWDFKELQGVTSKMIREQVENARKSRIS